MPEASCATVRAVTFDCWGTLIRDRDPAAATARRTEAISRLLGLDHDAADRLLQDAWDRHMDAWRRVSTFGPGRMAAYCVEQAGAGDEHVLDELTQAFEEATVSIGVDAVEGSVPTLEALAGAGIRRALVCDTGITPGRVVRHMLDALGIGEHLEVFGFSDEVGVPKPDPGLFAKVLAEL